MLQQADIWRLGPEVLKELWQSFSFKEGAWYQFEDLEVVVQESFPRTSYKRAYENLMEGRPVWDRVNNTVWVPVGQFNGSNLVGVLTLKGVERTVSPEEDSRWLPVLSQLVDNLYMNKKQMSIQTNRGEVPLYLKLWLWALRRGEHEKVFPFILYILGTDIQSINLPKIFKEIIYLGGNNHEGWWAVSGSQDKGALYFEKLSKAGVKRAFLFETEVYLREERSIEKEFSRLKKISKRLAFRMLSTFGIDDLLKRSGIGDDVEFLSAMGKLSRLRGYSSIYGLYGPGFRFEDKDGLRSIFRGESVFFFLKEDGPSSTSLLNDLDGVNVFFETSKETVSKIKVNIFQALFWTALHGSLLKEGSFFQTDSVTFQLAGDECFALGDLKAAKYYYKKTVKLNEQNVEAWNSLGVCYARLGKKKMAEMAFEEAIKRAPSDCMGYYNLGEIFLTRGEIKKAIKVLARAHELCRDEKAISTRYLEALIENYDDSEALRLLTEIKANLNNTKIPFRIERALARAEFFLGDLKAASVRARRVLSSRSSDPEALFIVAFALFAFEGEKDAAYKLLRPIKLSNFSSNRMRSKYIDFLRDKKLDE